MNPTPGRCTRHYAWVSGSDGGVAHLDFWLGSDAADRRRERRARRTRDEPQTDVSPVPEPFPLRRQTPVGWRLVCWLVAALFCWQGIATLLDASAPWLAQVGLPTLAVLAACLAWAYARAELLVDDVGVRVRGARTRTFPWSAVAGVMPSHWGFVFRLHDGRRVAAWATAKAGLQLLGPRYERALLHRLRSRVTP